MPLLRCGGGVKRRGGDVGRRRGGVGAMCQGVQLHCCGVATLEQLGGVSEDGVGTAWDRHCGALGPTGPGRSARLAPPAVPQGGSGDSGARQRVGACRMDLFRFCSRDYKTREHVCTRLCRLPEPRNLTFARPTFRRMRAAHRNQR